jgi:uncharacterized tellurite resistance protein B-like protein
MTLEEKIAFIKQLYQMSKSDGVIKPVEYSLMYEFALSLGVPLEKLEDILNEKHDFQITKEQVERIIQIYRLALIMNVDKEVTNEELSTLKKITLEMNLPPESVDLMIKRMSESNEGTLDYHTLMKIFDVSKN